MTRSVSKVAQKVTEISTVVAYGHSPLSTQKGKGFQTQNNLIIT
jgi:hypothetical protein